MMRRFVLPAVAALALLAVPSTLAAANVTPANGNDVILPNGNVYQLGDDGVYHWIPDVATANAMGVDWGNLQPMDDLDADVGNPLPRFTPAAGSLTASTRTPATSVTQANGNDFILPDGSVYQLDDSGVYHWIPDVATANAMNLDWGNLQPVDDLDGPVGTPIPSVG